MASSYRLLTLVLILLVWTGMVRWRRPVRLENLPARSAVYRVPINSADAAKLQLLPGIGPEMAQRIIDDRGARGPYESPAGLRRVRGLGDVTIARIAPLIECDHIPRK